MLSDCISDNVAKIKEGIKYYTFNSAFYRKYPSDIILRVLNACDLLDQIRAELDSSDIENFKVEKYEVQRKKTSTSCC